MHASDIAFSAHYHLVLRPDDLLQPLLSQLALMRNLAARDVHTAKFRLTVQRLDMALGRAGQPWHEVVAAFREQIRQHVGPREYSLYAPSFSTTNAIRQCGYDVALMDAFQSTFNYHKHLHVRHPKCDAAGHKAGLGKL